MGNVIYAASPLQVFLSSVGIIALLFGLGATGIVIAVVRRHQTTAARLAVGAAGLALVLAGSVMTVVTIASKSSGTQSMSAMLDSKQVARDACGENGETCPRYVLEVTTATTAIDFSVPQGAYERAEPGVCYEFTFYPNKGLFSSTAAPYQQISNLTRIETADPATCR